MPKTHRCREIVLLPLLLILGMIAWAALHHPPGGTLNDWSYLASVPAPLVLQAHEEGKLISPGAWADILALRSTLPRNCGPLVAQLKEGMKFTGLNWAGIAKSDAKTVAYRRTLLLKYPVFQIGAYTFPVNGRHWYEDTFGAGREGGKRRHEGTDIFGSEGTPIVSACSGKIERLGWNRLGGERVGVRGDDGNYYYYAHLQKISPGLQRGQRVARGETLGTMGHTGDALTTPDHLHFGIEIPDGHWINPYQFLRVWEENS
ncbi:Peptidase family M23 [Acididesulfobacillus acetoxydans]|uniref:Metalloendopeptidase-like membrane protein n=1 Tax=Acididesulfobacillus acetoxydans TaxID=1561005 RepID=A0A8S0Y3C5_9FIRM|nr:M23 family metallopeptidase [Acididesulfobacillus acetoxydans]CAA7601945.1 Peptidase family M23 [Acididesulfobacillus acetoxydans]CEJ08211.1 Metalloendopeptidase-like membrane protein [Acididesulfobacillus acetoxydans]